MSSQLTIWPMINIVLADNEYEWNGEIRKDGKVYELGKFGDNTIKMVRLPMNYTLARGNKKRRGKARMSGDAE